MVVSRAFAVSSDEAQAAISRAEAKMSTAYASVLEAERAGANVSSLLPRLNDGAALLARAQMCYQAGNFSGAVDCANQCSDSLNGTGVEATGLGDYATVGKRPDMLISALASAFAITGIAYAGIYGWRFFKDRYLNQVLEMKPEVLTDDSG